MPYSGQWRYVTAHAAARAQQRGIRIKELEVVQEFGDRFHGRGGALVFFLGTRAASRAFRRFGIRVDRFINTVLVISSDGSYLTTYKRQRPQRNWRSA